MLTTAQALPTPLAEAKGQGARAKIGSEERAKVRAEVNPKAKGNGRLPTCPMTTLRAKTGRAKALDSRPRQGGRSAALLLPLTRKKSSAGGSPRRPGGWNMGRAGALPRTNEGSTPN